MIGTAGILGALAVPRSNEEATLDGRLWRIACIFGLVFLASLPTWAALKALVGIRLGADAEFEGWTPQSAAFRPIRSSSAAVVSATSGLPAAPGHRPCSRRGNPLPEIIRAAK